jgi:hypothetical protein
MIISNSSHLSCLLCQIAHHNAVLPCSSTWSTLARFLSAHRTYFMLPSLALSTNIPSQRPVWDPNVRGILESPYRSH